MRTDDPTGDDRDDRRSFATGRVAADSSRAQSGAAGRATLIRMIEGEMVPRLLMLSRSAREVSGGAGYGKTTTNAWDVEELARLLVAHGPEIAWAFVEAVRRRGVPYDRICVELLAPAARRLAEQWEHRDFGKSELTMGLDGLRSVLVEIGNAAKSDRRISSDS